MKLSITEHIRIRKSDLIQLIENMDSNGDKYIDVSEVISALKKWKKAVKETGKYLKG